MTSPDASQPAESSFDSGSELSQLGSPETAEPVNSAPIKLTAEERAVLLGHPDSDAVQGLMASKNIPWETEVSVDVRNPDGSSSVTIMNTRKDDFGTRIEDQSTA